MNTWYAIFRCRKCGQLLLSTTNTTDSFETFGEFRQKMDRAYADNKLHPTCAAGIQDGEHVLCDLVSISRRPIKGTIELKE